MLDKTEVFEFLDALRESGATNMFGAGPYVEDTFGCDGRDARDLVIEWMETFSQIDSNQSLSFVRYNDLLIYRYQDHIFCHGFLRIINLVYQ